MLVIERKYGDQWLPWVWPGPTLKLDAIARRLERYNGKYGELRIVTYERKEEQ